MSNALAIAAVTAVLKDLLQNGLIDQEVANGLGDFSVSALPPDRVKPGQNGQDPSQLNLFLYQATPNQGWRNAALPSRDSRGERLSNPPLALDLHYLLSAYGANEFDAEILLGYAMQLFHETPVLTREAIRTALRPQSPVGAAILPAAYQVMGASELADQVEQVKITPHVWSTEEMSRLWSTFQTAYRPSAAYLVSLVLIEGRRSTRSSLPVRGYNVYAIPFQQPVVERVRSQAAAGQPIQDQPILPGYRLVLGGRGLRGQDTLVRVGAFEQPVADADASDSQLVVALPAGLRAGIQGAQVIQRLSIGTPPAPHEGVESNIVSFVLHPAIQREDDEGYAIEVSDLEEHDATRSATITVRLLPPVSRGQRVALVLNELGAPNTRPARSYSFRGPPWEDDDPAETDTVAFAVSGVEPGSYLVRLRVDGAESPLDFVPNVGYAEPKVEIV